MKPVIDARTGDPRLLRFQHAVLALHRDPQSRREQAISEAWRAIVWPEELAPDKPRLPTPPWSRRP